MNNQRPSARRQATTTPSVYVSMLPCTDCVIVLCSCKANTVLLQATRGMPCSLQHGPERVICVWQFGFDRRFSWTTMRQVTTDCSPLEVMT
jgi:hypothetical protein